MKRKIFMTALAVMLCLPIFASTNYSNMTTGISQLSLMKKYKNINIFSLNKLKQDSLKLTLEDKYVIIKYVLGAVKGENTFLLTNCYLRGNLDKYISKRDINKPLQGRLQFYADSLAKTVSKGRLPQNTLLYYGMEDKEVLTAFSDKGISNLVSSKVNEENLAVLKNKLLNKQYTEKGFMLSSYDKNNINKTKFRLIINAPKNLQAILIDVQTGKENKQVLINAGYKWKITDIEIQTEGNAQYYILNTKLVL